MVFTKLLLENSLIIRPYNYEAASQPLLPKVARCIPVLSSFFRKMRRPCFIALWLHYNKFHPFPLKLSEGGEENSIYHALAAPFNK